MIIAKYKDMIVHVVKMQHTVMFSEVKDWIFINFDFDKINRRRENFKWVQASTAQFEWVREYVDAD